MDYEGPDETDLDELWIASGHSARLVGSDPKKIEKLRRPYVGRPAFSPKGQATRDRFYPLGDVVRLGVLWRCRDFVPISKRSDLWKSIPNGAILRAARMPEGKRLFCMIAVNDGRLQVRFEDQAPDMTIPIEYPELVLDMTAVARGLWEMVGRFTQQDIQSFAPGIILRMKSKK